MEREVEKLPLPEKLGKAPAYEPSASGDRRGRGGGKVAARRRDAAAAPANGRRRHRGRPYRIRVQRLRRSPGRRVSKGAIPNAAVTAGDVIAGAAASRPKVRLRYRAEGMPPTEAGTPDRSMESKEAGTFEVPVSFWRRSPNFTPELRRSTTAKAGFAPSPASAGAIRKYVTAAGSPIHTADRKKIRK